MPSAGKTDHSLSALAGVALLATALALAGCGSSGDTTATEGGGGSTAQTTAPKTQGEAPKAPVGSSVTSCHDMLPEPAHVAGASCGEARSVVSRWVDSRSCKSSVGASRGSCTVGGYGCQST